ncbi:cysteine desulfurase [Halanaerobium saccharolyticum]|uniref:Cysteine desulfurase n=1 Tax=Halanaerobium saccharolyticum TaxID=43595 RepID=A0A4R7YU01_9FIRM|nr:cysteine desulfurase family protein [Halanaerobium saccharolyticum]RAK06649.1 cysteine desulfurase [Halanaerobium saccharolyticum]TDW01188.1 cysteine desulfurase [Halanaerobium saccharolyticum]TDX51456.1 cysteine desulfurase [Halanaerobium saccharolyticum]
MEREIYLDNAATTKALPEVTAAVVDALEKSYANPSSLHRFGLKSEKILKKSRKIIADYLGVKAKEVIFTSGGTESNNLAIRGITKAYKNRGRHLITSPIEHSSVAELFNALENEGWQVDTVNVDQGGHVDLEHLRNLITEETILVSIMQVNNELGTIQPTKKIAEIIKKKNPLSFFHVDGVQAFGKTYSNLGQWPVDLYSISGHKIQGPKGIGALYIKKGTNLTPLIYGGGQESNLRSGTENIPGIAGLREAVKKLPQLSAAENTDKDLSKKREYLFNLLQEIEEAVINSPAAGAPHIINFSLPGIKGETMLHALESQGIYISTSSACSSDKQGSRIINACGLSQKRSESALRVSLNNTITNDDLDYFIKTLKEQIDFLKLF